MQIQILKAKAKSIQFFQTFEGQLNGEESFMVCSDE
jgi:hypothetical protein